MSETTLNRAMRRKVGRLLGVDLEDTARAVILAIGGIKGGIGKSTSAIFLAYSWSLLGFNVLIIDADPKSGTSRKWDRRCRQRNQKLSFTVKAHPSEDLEERIVDEGWDQEFDLIIIDTGGDNDRILRAAYRIADRLLLTCSPSPADLDTLKDTAATVVDGMGQERDIEVNFLVTSAKSDRMTKEAKEEMRAAGLFVLTATVKHRLAYQDAYGWAITAGLDYPAVQQELDA